jgi:hypothetical protein
MDRVDLYNQTPSAPPMDDYTEGNHEAINKVSIRVLFGTGAAICIVGAIVFSASELLIPALGFALMYIMSTKRTHSRGYYYATPRTPTYVYSTRPPSPFKRPKYQYQPPPPQNPPSYYTVNATEQSLASRHRQRPPPSQRHHWNG